MMNSSGRFSFTRLKAPSGIGSCLVMPQIPQSFLDFWVWLNSTVPWWVLSWTTCPYMGNKEHLQWVIEGSFIQRHSLKVYSLKVSSNDQPDIILLPHDGHLLLGSCCMIKPIGSCIWSSLCCTDLRSIQSYYKSVSCVSWTAFQLSLDFSMGTYASSKVGGHSKPSNAGGLLQLLVVCNSF